MSATDELRREGGGAMSMLGMQADELRKMAAVMSERGSAIGLNYGMGLGLVDAARMMREAADTILSLRDRLQESYGQVPEQGEPDICGDSESYSRWADLFGTPERAAVTLVRTSDEHAVCKLPTWTASSNDYEAWLEWLNEEVKQ